MSLTAETAAVSTDPLLAPNSQRFVLFPIKYHQVWEMYKKHEVRSPPACAAVPRARPPCSRCAPSPSPSPPRAPPLGGTASLPVRASGSTSMPVGPIDKQ